MQFVSFFLFKAIMERKCLLKVALQIQEKNKNDFVHSDWLPSN